MVNVHSETPLEKANFSFASRYELQIVSWLGIEAHIYSPLLVLWHHLTWTCAGLMHVVIVSVCSYIHQFCCVLKMLISWSHMSPLAHIIFLPSLPHWFLNLEGRVLKTSLLGLSASKSFILCTFSNCRSLCLFPSTARRSFYDDWNIDLLVQQNVIMGHFIDIFL